eukprot:765968-Hanusia_phi.AAC.3
MICSLVVLVWLAGCVVLSSVAHAENQESTRVRTHEGVVHIFAVAPFWYQIYMNTFLWLPLGP